MRLRRSVAAITVLPQLHHPQLLKLPPCQSTYSVALTEHDNIDAFVSLQRQARQKRSTTCTEDFLGVAHDAKDKLYNLPRTHRLRFSRGEPNPLLFSDRIAFDVIMTAVYHRTLEWHRYEDDSPSDAEDDSPWDAFRSQQDIVRHPTTFNLGALPPHEARRQLQVTSVVASLLFPRGVVSAYVDAEDATAATPRAYSLLRDAYLARARDMPWLHADLRHMVDLNSMACIAGSHGIITMLCVNARAPLDAKRCARELSPLAKNEAGVVIIGAA